MTHIHSAQWTLTLCAFVAFLTIGISVPHALAATCPAGSIAINGYAWSTARDTTSGTDYPAFMGWISFGGPSSTYTVCEAADGSLSGYAWSGWGTTPPPEGGTVPLGLGWISFNTADVANCPKGMGNDVCEPKVDLTTGKITGWARACSAFADKNLCSGALDPNGGGWDGWISLSQKNPDGTFKYGITQTSVGSTCTWTGYAWGSTAIGAVSVSGPGYSVGNPSMPCPGGALPNLTVDTITPQSVSPLTSVNYSVTIFNASAMPVGTSFPYHFEVASGKGGTGTVVDLIPPAHPALTTGPLAPWGSVVVSSPSYVFDSKATPSIRACADKTNRDDKTGVVAESDEEDNCTNWEDIDVSKTCSLGPVGSSCPLSGNTCFTTGTVTADCKCQAPAYPPGYGTTCPAANGCSGTIGCTGTCVPGPTCVVPVPEVTIDATPRRVPACSVGSTPASCARGKTTITWTGTDIPSPACSITRNGSTWKSNLPVVAGKIGPSTQDDVISTQTTYKIDCGGVTATVVVNVLADFEQI